MKLLGQLNAHSINAGDVIKVHAEFCEVIEVKQEYDRVKIVIGGGHTLDYYFLSKVSIYNKFA